MNNKSTLKNIGEKIIARVKYELLLRKHIWHPVRLPHYSKNAPCSETCYLTGNKAQGNWYSPVLVSPEIIKKMSCSANSVSDVIHILQRLDPDPYIEYLLEFYKAGLVQYGEKWSYADITTVLLTVGKLIQPRKYLEIGVRRGRSMAMVAASSPQCKIVGFDLWMHDYSGAENPGAQFVKGELHRVGYSGNAEFVNGNSHRTVKEYLTSHPNEYFDLITVDGDHSKYGASLDLKDVLARLSIGGIIVFDDICHPCHLYLKSVWKRYVASQYRFASWEYTELGYGVAIGIRKY